MMEPIVSPWFVWAVGSANAVKTVLGVLAAIIGAAAVLMAINAAAVADECKPENASKWGKTSFKTGLVAMFFAFLCICAPSSKTMLGMWVAAQTTPNNVTTVVKAGKVFKDEIKRDVLDILETVQGKDEESGKR